MHEFLTYSKFYTEKQAEELSNFLKENNIEFLIEHEKELLDKIYLGNSLDALVLLKIKHEDFEKVNNLIVSKYTIDISTVDKDYYLFQFSNEELLDVMNNPEEWNYFDRALSKQILESSNKELLVNHTPDSNTTYSPIRLELIWLLAEYLLAIAFNYTGIIIGLITIVARKTLSNGKSVRIYDSWTIRHGYILMVVGLIRTIFFLFIVRLFD
jgi:hypothetical protein